MELITSEYDLLSDTQAFSHRIIQESSIVDPKFELIIFTGSCIPNAKTIKAPCTPAGDRRDGIYRIIIVAHTRYFLEFTYAGIF